MVARLSALVIGGAMSRTTAWRGPSSVAAEAIARTASS
jgi:hypothetical protein